MFSWKLRKTAEPARKFTPESRSTEHGSYTIEGLETGEWVLVDCGSAIVHIMQPALRAYYNLEELWGSHPVRMKLLEDENKEDFE